MMRKETSRSVIVDRTQCFGVDNGINALHYHSYAELNHFIRDTLSIGNHMLAGSIVLARLGLRHARDIDLYIYPWDYTVVKQERLGSPTFDTWQERSATYTTDSHHYIHYNHGCCVTEIHPIDPATITNGPTIWTYAAHTEYHHNLRWITPANMAEWKEIIAEDHDLPIQVCRKHRFDAELLRGWLEEQEALAYEAEEGLTKAACSACGFVKPCLCDNLA